jgi:ATP-dependent DNA helicase RecG
MVETLDGFVIAERDLSIRGPGDYFGTRQSGLPLFRVADMLRDRDILDEAKEEVRVLFEAGGAKTPEGEKILRHAMSIWGRRFGLLEAG